MAMEWSKSFSTGLEWQDNEHKELFKRVNRLLDAMSIGLGSEEIGRTLRFLDEYITSHFAREEREMHKYGYGRALEHISEHIKFIEDISSLRKDYDAHGVTTRLLIMTQRELISWLLNHMATEDKELGAFLKDKQEKPALASF